MKCMPNIINIRKKPPFKPFWFNWVHPGADNRTCSERNERNSDCFATCANIVYAKQTVLSHHRALRGTLRVLFVCYVRYTRFPQMLRACVSLCLRSAAECRLQTEFADNVQALAQVLCSKQKIKKRTVFFGSFL